MIIIFESIDRNKHKNLGGFVIRRITTHEKASHIKRSRY